MPQEHILKLLMFNEFINLRKQWVVNLKFANITEVLKEFRMRILRAAKGIYDPSGTKPRYSESCQKGYFNYLFLTDKCNYWTLSKESIWKIFRIKNFLKIVSN